MPTRMSFKVGEAYELAWECRDIGYGVESDAGEYVYHGRDQYGKFAFTERITDNQWNVIIRDTGGIRSDFALTAGTPAIALSEASRNLAHSNIDVRKIELQSIRPKTVYLFEDEIVSAVPVEAAR